MDKKSVINLTIFLLILIGIFGLCSIDSIQNDKIIDDHYPTCSGSISMFWSHSVGLNVESTPALGDINGDNTLEVFFGCNDNKIYALYGQNGSLIWTVNMASGTSSAPALGDIDGDGKLEVVIGSADDNLYTLNGEDGSEVWKVDMGASIYSSPALADIDNDGLLEILFGISGKIFALNAEDGSE